MATDTGPLPDRLPLWPPSPAEWALMGDAERAPWLDRLAMAGTPDAADWLPGSLGWRALTEEERALDEQWAGDQRGPYTGNVDN